MKFQGNEIVGSEVKKAAEKAPSIKTNDISIIKPQSSQQVYNN